MKAYSFISALFAKVLSGSKRIDGRFYILPKGGSEMNSDELDQVMNQVKPDGIKFPVCYMLPPRSTGTFAGSSEWEQFSFTLFFLDTTYYTGGNQIKAMNPATATSSQPVINEWDEMKQAAVDFMKVLDVAQRFRPGSEKLFTLSNRMKNIEPVSFSGTSRLSGVRMDFQGSLWLGCEVDDYEVNGEGQAIILDSLISQ